MTEEQLLGKFLSNFETNGVQNAQTQGAGYGDGKVNLNITILTVCLSMRCPTCPLKIVKIQLNSWNEQLNA